MTIGDDFYESGGRRLFSMKQIHSVLYAQTLTALKLVITLMLMMLRSLRSISTTLVR